MREYFPERRSLGGEDFMPIAGAADCFADLARGSADARYCDLLVIRLLRGIEIKAYCIQHVLDDICPLGTCSLGGSDNGLAID